MNQAKLKLATLRKEDVAAELGREFKERFGESPRLFTAPGRVNLIGEHTDYNDGWVMPVAIEFGTLVAIAPRDDRQLCLVSLNFDEELTFPLQADAQPSQSWSDYAFGVAVTMLRSGHQLSGANLILWGSVPLGAGLSSSASVEVATAVALLGMAGEDVAREEVARLCQRAENEFVGARCGIMDQFIAANGQAGNALKLDCRSLAYDAVPLPGDVSIVVFNTMVKHQHSGSEYNTRRAECEEGVRLLQQWFPEVRSLRDVSEKQLEEVKSQLPAVIFRRCRHVLTENARVLEFAQALRAGGLGEAGVLMGASHRSLRDDYEVSCPELDILVDLASRVPGSIGSRMTGGGFGGCTVSLVRDDAVESFRTEVAEKYREILGVQPEIYVTRAAQGASEIV